MGGVVTDLGGRSSGEGLYAAGECARTGVHGANRLASNSLLEAAAFGRRAGAAAVDAQKTRKAGGARKRPWHPRSLTGTPVGEGLASAPRTPRAAPPPQHPPP